MITFKSKLLLLILAMTSYSAWSQTLVPIIWPFAMGSMQANYVRAIAEDANSRQTKYQFVFEHRPGAGGSIAMNHALNSQRLTIVSNSSSVFTRPLYYPDSYDISQFSPILTQVVGQPVAIISKKYSSMAELKKQTKLSIGMINGSITQLLAESLSKRLPGIDVVFVPYQGTTDVVRDVVAGHIDLGIEFAADLQTWMADKRVNVIGITGKQAYPGFPAFVDLGYPEFENLVVNYFFVVSTNVPESVRQELNEILRMSNRSAKVVNLYRRDFAIPVDHDLQQSVQLWRSLQVYWQTFFKK